MTEATHTYRAYVIGTPDVEISLDDGGDVSLDASRWPHVKATIATKATPAILSITDPRTAARIRLVADVDSPSGAQHREFNLGIRARSVSQDSASVTLDLASDEALANDYRPLSDDLTPLNHQASLRAVVGYVLGKAIPGAALQAMPSNDGDVTTYTDAENTFRDPRAMGSFVGGGCTVATDAVWPGNIDGVAHKSMWLHTSGSTDSYGYLLTPGSMNGFEIGKTYVVSATGRVHTPQGGTQFPGRVRSLVVFMDVGGYVSVASPPFPSTGTPGRVAVEFTVPTGCKEVFVRAYHGAVGGEVKWSQFRVTPKSTHPGVDDTVYFWGGKPDTAAYDYSYIGTPDQSVSKRRAVIDRKPDLLVWKAGKSAIDFLHPIVQAHGLRLVCDEQRRWTLRDEHFAAPGVLTIRDGVNLYDGEDTIDRDGDMWFDAAIVYYRWIDYDGTQRQAVDSYALPGATRAVEVVRESPYPGDGFAEYLVRRAQHRGREVTATAPADWSVAAEQPITVTLSGAPVQVGATTSVQFALGTDRMTVRTQTTDTPPGAINLLGGTINSLPGTINAL